MVERQLRRRGITDECVLEAMEEPCRASCSCRRGARRDAYRDGAVGIDEGQTMSQPWIVACMTSLLEPEGRRDRARGGRGLGLRRGGAVPLRRAVVTIERHAPLAEQAARRSPELGYDNVEVRVGDGTAGAPDDAPFGGISVTAPPRPARPRRCSPSSRPGRRSSARSARDRECSMRFRDGAGASRSCRSGSCRWCGDEDRVVREFSAGGICVRRMRGREWVAAIRVKNGKVLALPKGNIDPGETAAEAARARGPRGGGRRRRARREARRGQVLVRPPRPERVFKVVSFFLLRYRSGSVKDHDHEVDAAEWVPLEDAERLLEYKGEKQMAAAALTALREAR